MQGRTDADMEAARMRVITNRRLAEQATKRIEEYIRVLRESSPRASATASPA